jgi:hypothetical protein
MYGEDALPVSAAANPGYIFIGWSDSETSNPSVDSNITSDLNIKALFEKSAPELSDIAGKITGDKTASVSVTAVSLLTGESVAVAVSDETGSFIFENLPSGVYELSLVVPEGYSAAPDVIRVYTDKPDDEVVFKLSENQSDDNIEKVIPENDEYSLLAGKTLTVPAPGILSNDLIPEGVTVEAVVAEKPSHGALTLNGDGSFEYRPEEFYFGRDQFKYSLVLEDGSVSDSAEVVIDLAPEMISVGSLISLKDFASDKDDVKAMKMKVYGRVEDKNYRLRINTKDANGVNAVWVKRLRLIAFRPGKSELGSLKLAEQAKSVDITLKTKDNESVIRKVLFVPPQITECTVSGSELNVSGSFFGPKVPKVYLVSQIDNKYIKCKVSKQDYMFDALSGKSMLKAEIPSDRVNAGECKVVIFNKVGVGVFEDNTIPAVDIK